jgi:hypothetical protein
MNLETHKHMYRVRIQFCLKTRSNSKLIKVDVQMIMHAHVKLPTVELIKKVTDSRICNQRKKKVTDSSGPSPVLPCQMQSAFVFLG